MATIRLFNINKNNTGVEFIIKDYPELRLFESYATRKQIKRVNVEQYFRGVNRNYLDYNKVIYGPVFGMDDKRNGFIYEHKTTEELLLVDEADIPATYETCSVITGYLLGICTTDPISYDKHVVTSYGDMTQLSTLVSNPVLYNSLIRDEWISNESFIIIS